MPMPIETRAHLIAADIRLILLSYPAIAQGIDDI
jgi:hypothetical protein